MKKFANYFLDILKKPLSLQSLPKAKVGTLAQLVEQRTENPCVPSSNLGGTTNKKATHIEWLFFYTNFNKKVARCFTFDTTSLSLKKIIR